MACLFPHNDVYKYHAVLCASQGERIFHHNHLRDAIYQAAVSATVGPKREESELLPGLEARPVDIFIPLWQEVETMHWILQLCLLSKYGEDCRAEWIVFTQMVIEISGSWEEGQPRSSKDWARHQLGQPVRRMERF